MGNHFRAGLLRAQENGKRQSEIKAVQKERAMKREARPQLELNMPACLPPRTHAGDPVTSHKAEERARMGGLSEQMQVVLAAVGAHPGLTATEISEREWKNYWCWKQNPYERLCQIRRRLSDLKALNRVTHRRNEGEREVRWYRATGW